MSKATMSESKENEGCALALAPFLAVPMYWYQAFADGFVLSKLWLWYAVPHGLPALAWQTFAAASMAYGLIRLKVPRNEPADSRSKEFAAMAMVFYWAAPWLTLLVAWLVKP